jgi:hypothetical protein
VTVDQYAVGIEEEGGVRRHEVAEGDDAREWGRGHGSVSAVLIAVSAGHGHST